MLDLAEDKSTPRFCEDEANTPLAELHLYVMLIETSSYTNLVSLDSLKFHADFYSTEDPVAN